MKRTSIAALVAALLCAVFSAAQNPPQMPKPGPELEKLKYFLGTWKMEGDMKPNPMGPGGKFTATEHNEWMPGGFFVVGHSNGSMAAMGKITGTAFMGYNPEEKVYTYNEFNSMGEAEASKGTIEGDTWTWTSEEKMQGKMVKGRFTMNIASPTSYTFKYEASMDGSDYATIMEGKATKVGAAAAGKTSAAKAPAGGNSGGNGKTPKTK